MSKTVSSSGGLAGADDFIKYHQKMWKEMSSLEKIASELDEVRSVDIFQEWCMRAGSQSIPRPEQMKALLESFTKGITEHFGDEAGYLRDMERNENLRKLARTFLGDHAKFLNELKSRDSQLKALLAQQTGTEENLERWKILVAGLKNLLRDIGNHALEEEELIFKISHNI